MVSLLGMLLLPYDVQQLNTVSRLRQSCIGPIAFVCGSNLQLQETMKSWLVNGANEGSLSRNRLIGFINPHVFNLSFQHSSIQRFYKHADAICVDGIGIKLAIGLKTGHWLPRVVAEHLFEGFLSTLDFPVNAILIGGEPSAAKKAGESMYGVNNNLTVVATLDGYSGVDASREFIVKHKNIPRVLLGVGTPSSEVLALIAKEVCEEAVIFHIGGGTLNTYAGAKKRGPKWVSRMGLEWLHRIINEPHTRHRYTSGGWLFLKNLLATWSFDSNQEGKLS